MNDPAYRPYMFAMTFQNEHKNENVIQLNSKIVENCGNRYVPIVRISKQKPIGSNTKKNKNYTHFTQNIFKIFHAIASLIYNWHNNCN